MTFRKIGSILLLTFLLAACQNAGGSSSTTGSATLTDLAEVPRITPEELKALLDAGQEVVIIDSRALKPYEVRHLPGAISMPLKEVDERYDELPKNAKIVIYCT